MDSNGVPNVVGKYWEQFVGRGGPPPENCLTNILYVFYTNITCYNVMLFVLKFLPMGIYLHKFVRNMYTVLCEKMKQRNREIDDILLKIEIINTKISCREAEFIEREKKLISFTERLHMVRAQVRQIIANNEDLRQELNRMPLNILHLHVNMTSEEESKLFEEIIKNNTKNQAEEPPDENKIFDENYDSGGINNNTNADNDNKDYNIKIVEVTNVYEMSYLQNYLKLKRLQKSKKQDVLKKQMNKTKKVLNDWHKALNAVTKNRNVESEIESGEAMGDYNKAYGMVEADSNSTDYADNLYDEYDVENQNDSIMYTNYCYNDTSEDVPPMQYDTRNIYDNCHNCQMATAYKKSALYELPEETNSQLEIDRLEFAE